MKKSQVSTEYLVIMGFAVLATIPMLAIYYSSQSEASESASTSQALQIARAIVDNSESVYYIGEPSKVTLKLNFPNNIQSATLDNREVLFKVRTRAGLNDIFQVSNVNITGSLPTSAGIHIITIASASDHVVVSSN